jgi:amidase
MSFAEYSNYDALGLAALVRERKISARELVDEAIARIELINPRLNAVIRLLAEQAHSAAGAPLPSGPFAGVPFLIKDLLTAYKGVPLASGCRAFRDFVPSEDSELVRRHKASGLIIVGKTNTPELGLQPVCEPELFGPTLNPWNPECTSGGSSGGSAAAVAAGIVPMAHGGDGGGSLRIPAACCGLFGFKPSRGRMPTGPHYSEHWWGCAVEHAVTRSVRDSAALLDATSGAQPGDAHHLPRPARPFLDEIGAPPGKLRILWTKQPFMIASLHADCATAVENTAKRLADLGHAVDEGTVDVDPITFSRDFFLFACIAMATEIEEGSVQLGRKIRSSQVETSTWLSALLGRQASAVAFARARERTLALGRRVDSLYEKYDLLLTPTLASPPLPIGALSPKGIERATHKFIAASGLGLLLRLPGVVNATVKKVFSFIPFTPLANVTGQPSMSVPLDWNQANLPIGSMFTARLGDEATLFRLAAQLEAAYPWADKRPGIHADTIR